MSDDRDSMNLASKPHLPKRARFARSPLPPKLKQTVTFCLRATMSEKSDGLSAKTQGYVHMEKDAL